VLPIAALSVFIVALAGCAATPSVTDSGPRSAELAKYKAMAVTVDAPEAVRQQTGFDATSSELLNEFLSNVKTSGKFALLAAQARDPGGLDVRLTIDRLSYVHGATRGLVGILGGRAELTVTMTVRDQGTGEVLRVVRADHSSSHAQGVFSPTTSRQVSAMAKELSAKLE
jgi:hypothetical protein